MNILIVEDEKSLALEVNEFLTNEGFTVEHARTKRSAEEKILATNYDFILLDLNLPDGDGFDTLKTLKSIKNRDDAVIILTARGAVDDRVEGLEQGADDYLAKPFSLLELQSRMQAITRRKYGLKDNIVRLGDFLVNLTDRAILFGTEGVSGITKKEFDLVAYLILHKNRTVTRNQLSEHIWGSVVNDDYDSNYIDAHIKNIRKKLNAYAPADWLETVRGLGYKIRINA